MTMTGVYDPQAPSQVPPEVKEDVGRRLHGPITSIRSRRRVLEEKWLYFDAAYRAEVRPERKKFRSEFDYYIPVARRSCNRFVNRMVQMLLPSSDFFECYPGDETVYEKGVQADSVRAWMSYLLRRRLKIRRLVGEASRSLAVFGRAIVKTGVTTIRQMVDYGGVQGPLEEVWPTARTVDPFSFYVWPETVSNVEDVVLVFEDSMIPISQYQGMAQSGLCDPIDPVEVGPPEWPHHIKTRMAYQGFPEPSAMSAAQISTSGQAVPVSAAQKFVAMTEAWFYGEDNRLIQAWLVWNVPGGPRCTRVNFSEFPEIPYLVAQAAPMPADQYSLGLMADLEPLQILYNDQVAQGEMARAIAGSPPIAIDPSKGRADNLVLGYGKKWSIQDPKNSIYIPEMPDTYSAALKAQANTLGMIDVLGASPRMLEGQPTRGLPRGSGAVQSLIQLASADIKDYCEIMETEVLTPLLARLHRLTKLFVPPAQVLQVPGTQYYPAKSMTVQDLDGNWDLVWVGSQQAQELRSLAQSMTSAAEGLAKVEPMLNAMGSIINWPLFIKRIWRDGMGERGVEQIILPMTVGRLEIQAQQMVNAAGPMPPVGVMPGQPGPQPGMPASPEEAAQQQMRAQQESVQGRNLA